MNISELPNEVRDWARQSFVDNECGSDEYRETQPQKGFMYIAEMWSMFEAGTWRPEEELDALQEVRDWLNEMLRVNDDPNSQDWEKNYAGAHELSIVLTRMFDMGWKLNYHPYNYDAETISNDYHDSLQEA